MMSLLVLGGGSQKNKTWVDECASFFRHDFSDVNKIYYEHWRTGEKDIDFELEMKKISSLLAGKEITELYVCAKSIGSILALKCIEKNIIRPNQCVFFGMPLKIASGFNNGDWSFLKALDIPTLAFHNDEGSTADYIFTVNTLKEFAPQIELITLKGDNHDYFDFSDYKDEIDKFYLDYGN